jgi:polysaccharide pyruvyl transferase CsaB
MKKTQLDIYKQALRKNAKGFGEKTVMICGAYGRGNSGDDAILEAILATLRGIDPALGICVLSRKPRATRLTMLVDSIYIFNLFRFFHRLSKTDLFISGGGTLIQDATSTRSLLFYLFTLSCAKKKGCKVMLYGCGIGPVSRPGNVQRTARVLNKCADVITLREPLSLEVLKEFGVTHPEIVLSADPALGLIPVSQARASFIFEREKVPEDAACICFALRRWKDFDKNAGIIAETARYAYERYDLSAAFIPMENPTDFAAIRPVLAGLSTPSYVFKGKYTPSENIAILSKMRIVVGMRLHSLVFAASRGVEVIALAYDQKVSGFMDYMNLDLCVELKDLTAEQLRKLVDTAASRLSTHAETLLENSRHLKEKEGLNGFYAAKLLEL